MTHLRLREMQAFFCAIRLLDFDLAAVRICQSLRAEHRRLSKMDLRIAATALAHDGVLVTRNQSDFSQISRLSTADWSVS